MMHDITYNMNMRGAINKRVTRSHSDIVWSVGKRLGKTVIELSSDSDDSADASGYINGVTGHMKTSVSKNSVSSDGECGETRPHSDDGWLTKRRNISVREKLKGLSFAGNGQRGGGRRRQCARVKSDVTAGGGGKQRSYSPSTENSGSQSSSDTVILYDSSCESSEECSSQSSTSDANSSCFIVDTESDDSAQSLPSLSGKASLSVADDSARPKRTRLFGSRERDPLLAAPTLSDKAQDRSTNSGSFYGRTRATARTNEALQDVNLEELEKGFESDSFSDSEDYSAKKRKAVLQFLNESCLEELCDIQGCSVSRAKLLIELRPFEKWSALVSV